MAHDHKTDMRAAFMGLIFGAIALLLLLYGMVRYTNSRYASHQTPAAQH